MNIERILEELKDKKTPLEIRLMDKAKLSFHNAILSKTSEKKEYYTKESIHYLEELSRFKKRFDLYLTISDICEKYLDIDFTIHYLTLVAENGNYDEQTEAYARLKNLYEKHGNYEKSEEHSMKLSKPKPISKKLINQIKQLSPDETKKRLSKPKITEKEIDFIKRLTRDEFNKRMHQSFKLLD